MAFAMPFFMDRKTARSSESCNMLSDDLFCLPKSEPVSCNARKLYDIYQDYANAKTVKFFQFVNSLLE